MKNFKDKFKKEIIIPFFIMIIIIIFAFVTLEITRKFNSSKEYKASDFNIKTIYSKVDYDKDNIDDYTDIILGARKQVGNNLTSKELLLVSLSNAGYNLDEEDILSYLEQNYKSLTKDYNDIKEWQPGDIVVFENNIIGIISDKRNHDGITYVIYNNGEKVVEDNYLNKESITCHYRFEKVSK